MAIACSTLLTLRLDWFNKSYDVRQRLTCTCVVEVKSHKDKLARAEKQLEAISYYVDYSYVASARASYAVGDDKTLFFGR